MISIAYEEAQGNRTLRLVLYFAAILQMRTLLRPYV